MCIKIIENQNHTVKMEENSRELLVQYINKAIVKIKPTSKSRHRINEE